ncbi:MAG: tRNA (guanosine(46)-N7)-methyltransferase TrmB [Gammaproteobacteria bacterium]
MTLSDPAGAASWRRIRSFVLRAGRMTAAQERALSELLPHYLLSPHELAQPGQAFQRHAALYLEIGIGNGDNLVAMAERHPEADFIGCEVHRPGLGHVLNLVRARDLRNVRVVDTDVRDLLAALIPASLDGVYMFFPDPWPKKRHHKRRLLNDALLDSLAGKLKSNGCFYFATDDADYGEAALTTVDAAPAWQNLAGVKASAPRPRWRVVTRFEARARAAGRPVCEIISALRR